MSQAGHKKSNTSKFTGYFFGEKKKVRLLHLSYKSGQRKQKDIPKEQDNCGGDCMDDKVKNKRTLTEYS